MLKKKGLSADQYTAIWIQTCASLREGITRVATGVAKMNEIGCVACYAEYRKGCKATDRVHRGGGGEGRGREFMKE